ncbi:helix-turn-helix domain-containing protein [Flavobacterium daejeonense]|uniref:helix-turn-helix domain-containing protein n=1 Tax=Flavobacterium daejeonense TaxID=350893 RepID=UPI00047AF85D|nr:AraC family transcriptional regulator [Flavobacterium daejeonense]
MKQVFDFVMISGVLLGIIFIITTLCFKKKTDKAILYLNLVIAFLILNNLQAFSLETFLADAPFFIKRLQIPWYVLIVPSFYVFLTYYLKIEKKISSYVYISFSIFIIEILIRIALYPHYYHLGQNMFIAKYVQIEEIINACYSIFLFIKTLLVLFKYTDLYQQILVFDNLKWLRNLMFLGAIIILMWVCAILLNLDKTLNPQVLIYYPLRLSTTTLLYWISYQGFYNYSLMTERIELRKAILTEEKNKESNLANNYSNDSKFQPVKNYIEKNKRYIDPNFSLEKLASEMNISTSKLSHLINQESGYNFSDYINYLRVEKAKKYLNNPNYSAYTILAIGLECGFNSKSTFYSAFKKFTSLTPSEYKEK